MKKRRRTWGMLSMLLLGGLPSLILYRSLSFRLSSFAPLLLSVTDNNENKGLLPLEQHSDGSSTPVLPSTDCEEEPTGPLVKRPWHDPPPLSSFLELCNDNNSRNANMTVVNDDDDNHVEALVCEFFATPHSKHFPHAMQQLYRCWSYWWQQRAVMAINTNTSTRPLVLVGPQEHRGFRETLRPDFFTHMLEAIQQAFGVTVVTTNDVPPNQCRVRSNLTQDHFALASPDDAEALTHGILQHLQIPRRACGPTPRVGLLNRNAQTSKRSLLHATHVAQQWEQHLKHATVDVAYFEDATFPDQLTWWAGHDVVVSPHGAQWTGLPFLPACAQVVEVLPLSMHHMAYYYGSLAQAAGKGYFRLAVLDDDDGNGNTTTLSAPNTQPLLFERMAARKANTCPATTSLVQAVETALSDWHTCCQEQQQY